MDDRRTYRFQEYPGGCRCSCCKRLFEEGDDLFDRWVGSVDGANVTSPVCGSCRETNAPLDPRHPYATGGGRVVLRGDGFVDRVPEWVDVI